MSLLLTDEEICIVTKLTGVMKERLNTVVTVKEQVPCY